MRWLCDCNARPGDEARTHSRCRPACGQWHLATIHRRREGGHLGNRLLGKWTLGRWGFSVLALMCVRQCIESLCLHKCPVTKWLSARVGRGFIVPGRVLETATNGQSDTRP